MKILKNIGLVALMAALGLLSSLWIFSQTHAQIVAQQGRIDAFTFYIPYSTDRLDNQFDVGYSAISLLEDDIETTIAIPLREESVIYYDHWEDGLEPDLTAPVQFSTQVWGDNDPTNGIPPGFATDVLNAGDVIVLRNTVVLPRNPADLFFDGGDVLTSIGGAVAVTLAVWPIHDPAAPPPPFGLPEIGPLFAGAWELYPTNRWGTEYLIPVGEDLAGDRAAFTRVGVNVQAALDDTTVDLDLDADGTFETTVTLNQGEQFNEVRGVLVGARIRASDRVQVHVFTANPASNYEARAYTIVPFDQWSDDILAPRSSDGDFWLYNPDSSDLIVTVQTIITTSVITIPGGSTVKYPPVGLSAATGLRFTSTDGRPFYGVAALDADDTQDWGYALQPVALLTTQTLIGIGVGNVNVPPDGDQSRVYVTSCCATTVFVDYDDDGTVDNSFPVSPLQEAAITDPSDFDMTGAFLFTDDQTPFLAVWGQDQSADPALPSIDVGTSAVPLPSVLLQKTFSLATDSDCTGTVTLDDAIQYRLEYFNNSVDPVRNLIIEDDLPPQVAYIPNSAMVNGDLIPDGGGGTPFPLDNGGFNVGTIDRVANGLVTFDVTISDATFPIVNRALASSADLPLDSDTVIIFTPDDLALPVLDFKNTLVSPTDATARSGEVITFNLIITNTSSFTITELPLQDTFKENHLTFLNATPPADVTAAGVISWNDLTTVFGDLLPNMTISATVSFVVDQVPATIDQTTLEATVLEAKRSDRPTPLICTAVAGLNFAGGGTATPTSTRPSNGDKTPTSTSTPKIPTATPPVTPVGTPSDLPVAFLPETGTKKPSQIADLAIDPAFLVLTLLGVGLAIIRVWPRMKYRLNRRR